MLQVLNCMDEYLESIDKLLYELPGPVLWFAIYDPKCPGDSRNSHQFPRDY